MRKCPSAFRNRCVFSVFLKLSALSDGILGGRQTAHSRPSNRRQRMPDGRACCDDVVVRRDGGGCICISLYISLSRLYIWYVDSLTGGTMSWLLSEDLRQWRDDQVDAGTSGSDKCSAAVPWRQRCTDTAVLIWVRSVMSSQCKSRVSHCMIQTSIILEHAAAFNIQRLHYLEIIWKLTLLTTV